MKNSSAQQAATVSPEYLNVKLLDIDVKQLRE